MLIGIIAQDNSWFALALVRDCDNEAPWLLSKISPGRSEDEPFEVVCMEWEHREFYPEHQVKLAA